MKLTKIKIKNFRSYSDEVVIKTENLTTFVGKNDAGKSTILEALDIFFEGGIVKIDRDDINKKCLSEGDDEIIITACFSDLPNSIIIDSSSSTSLKDEYLLNIDGELEIIKKFKGAGKARDFVKANHPTNPNCNDLLTKSNKDLKDIINSNNIDCENKSVNAIMRKAIWKFYSGDLQLKDVEIDLSKDNDAKNIWIRLKDYIPIYFLFQSDRKNSDSDNEVQDPLKVAIEQILSSNDLKNTFEEISIKVKEKLEEVVFDTLEKLKEINPHLADTLTPKIPNKLDWRKAFNAVSISSNNEIPINKRGSGVKRLILLSFFRAQAEKKKLENGNRGVIYAIEEPETSQHFDHQKILIKSLKELSKQDNVQIIMTTHSAIIVKELKFENIRLICRENNSNNILVKNVEQKFLPTLSLNEVNYLAFKEATFEYHQELYTYLYDKLDASNQCDFNEKLHNHQIEKNKIWNKQINGESKPEKATLPYYIRNKINHPEAPNNENIKLCELEESIEAMQKILIDL